MDNYSNNQAAKGFCFAVILFVAFGMFLGYMAYSHFTHRISYGQEIGMCQPNGWFLDRDLKCSEVNVNNSVANANNGQYHESVAVATAIVGANERANNQQFKQGAWSVAPITLCIGAVLGIVGLFVLVAILANVGRGGSNITEV